MARLEAHAREFFDLPVMQVPAVMNDADVEAHNDLIYIRSLVDALFDAKVELQQEIRDHKAEHGAVPPEPTMWLQFLCHSAEAFPRTPQFVEPWPEDHAVVLLASWPSPVWEAA